MTDTTPFSKTELLTRIERGWNEFNIYLNTLTEAQLTTPTDAAGWTAKDHITHLAVWEDGIHGLLGKQPRWENMGIDEALWLRGDYDEMNAVIQQRHKDISAADARKMLHDSHQRLVGKVQSMTEEALTLPYKHYQPNSDLESPVWHRIVGNTFGHFEEHQPWIAAIVGEN
jgi:hypothetical protein